MVQPSNGKPDSKADMPLLVKLATECLEDSHRWFPNMAYDVPFLTLAMCGEAGELANIVKKIERGSLSYDDSRVRYDLAMELTDVFIYLLNLAAVFRINLEESYRVKRTENVQRFGRVATPGANGTGNSSE